MFLEDHDESLEKVQIRFGKVKQETNKHHSDIKHRINILLIPSKANIDAAPRSPSLDRRKVWTKLTSNREQLFQTAMKFECTPLFALSIFAYAQLIFSLDALVLLMVSGCLSWRLLLVFNRNFW
jgi:hypothetical protein